MKLVGKFPYQESLEQAVYTVTVFANYGENGEVLLLRYSMGALQSITRSPAQCNSNVAQAALQYAMSHFMPDMPECEDAIVSAPFTSERTPLYGVFQLSEFPETFGYCVRGSAVTLWKLDQLQHGPFLVDQATTALEMIVQAQIACRIGALIKTYDISTRRASCQKNQS